MQVLVQNGVATMSSLALVDFINEDRQPEESVLRHDHFMAKVPKVLGDAAPKFLGTAPYINGTGAKLERAIYNLPKREACLMAMSYSYELQAKVFDRMTELEAQQAKTNIALPNFANPAEAARAWALEYEARIHAEATKAEIGNRREATAMNTASQATKKATRLEIELDKSKEYATVKRMEMLYHGTKFNWRLLKSTAIDMEVPPIDVFDANYGKVNAYHASVWLEAYAVAIEVL
jgi:hypothetical protein